MYMHIYLSLSLYIYIYIHIHNFPTDQISVLPSFVPSKFSTASSRTLRCCALPDRKHMDFVAVVVVVVVVVVAVVVCPIMPQAPPESSGRRVRAGNSIHYPQASSP